MNTDAILRHAVLTWLLFPAIAIPVSLTAHRLGHTDWVYYLKNKHTGSWLLPYLAILSSTISKRLTEDAKLRL